MQRMQGQQLTHHGTRRRFFQVQRQNKSKYKYLLTRLRNVSLDLHPLVGGDGLCWLGSILRPVRAVEVVRRPQFGEVVWVEAVVLAGVRHTLQVGVERARSLRDCTITVMAHVSCSGGWGVRLVENGAQHLLIFFDIILAYNEVLIG